MLLRELQWEKRQLVIGGDGRADSPGHSAKFGSYTVMELKKEVVIKEYGSTLYVGLARAVSPTNTNFRLTFLLTRLQEALYEDLAV